MFISRLGLSSVEEVRRTKHLGQGYQGPGQVQQKTNRSYRCSNYPKRWIKGLVSTSVYNKGLKRSKEVIPTSTIQTGLKINLSTPRATNKQWQQKGPWA